MKKYAVAVAVCALLVAVLATYTGASGPEAKAESVPQDAVKSQTDPKAKAAYAAEWAEVRKKYPRFAAQHLKMKEALSEAVVLSANKDMMAYKSSALAGFVLNLCATEERRNWVICQEEIPPPVNLNKCRRCSACSVPGLDVDCANCLQQRADNGCL